MAHLLHKALHTTLLASTIATGILSGQALAQDQNELTVVPDFFTSFVRNFNPYLTTSLRTTREFIYEPLVVFNEMQGNKPVYRLATGMHTADDLMSVTFDLREGVLWSDGEAFNADDVVFSFAMIKAHPELDTVGIYKWISGVEKLSSHQVRFQLNEVNTAVANELVKVPIVAQHIWQDVENPVTFSNPNPIGTGPFTEISRFSNQLYVQCRNPNYWDQTSLKIDCLRAPQIANNDQLLASIVSGELDWTSSFIPDVDRVYADRSPDHKYWYTPAGTTAFVLNFKSPDSGNREAINDLDFRHAFSMAMDRETIIDFAAYGNGVVNDYASGLGPAFSSWSDDEVYHAHQTYMTFNPEKARQLLTESGYQDIDGDGFVETPTGKKLNLTIISPNGWTDFNNVVQLGVEMLAEVGIQAKAATPEFAVLNSAMANADFDVAFTNYFHGPTPFKYLDTAYHSKYQAGEQFGRFAMHHYQDKELDVLLDSFNKTASAEEQKQIVHKIQARIAANQTTVPIYSGVNFYQYNTKRFKGWFSADNPVARPQIWRDFPERLLQVVQLEPR